MKDQDKSTPQLLAELAELRKRVSELEQGGHGTDPAKDDLGPGTFSAIRAIEDSNLDIISRFDRDFRHLYVTPVIQRVTGLPPEHFLGKTNRDLGMPADLCSLWEEKLRQAFAGNRTLLDFDFVTPAGQTRTYEAVLVPERAADGSVATVLGFAHDVTEIKQAEEAKRQSEEKYRVLVEASPDGVILADLDGHIVFASQAIAELHRSNSVEEMAGKHALDFIAPEDHSRFLANLRRTLEEGVSRDHEYAFVRKDGTRFPGEVSGAVVRDASGRPTALMALVRDVSQRKAAEKALRQSHDELQAIYDGMAHGLLITDVENRRFLRANRAICQMTGYSEQELLSMSVKDIHPADELATVYEKFEGLVEGRIRVAEEIPVLRQDGSIFYADITASTIIYNGRLCANGFFRDVTERRHARETLQREHRTLQHLLRSSDHERQLIAYEIHDGLAQQLAGAIMQFQSYENLKELRPSLAAKAYEAGMTMLRQSHFEARRLISGVRPPILDESGIVAAIAHLVHDQNLDRGPKIEFQSKVTFDRLASVLENSIYRIVQEGLANAAKHSKSEKVRIRLLQDGDRVRLEIRDWGVGFVPEKVAEDRFGLEGIRERARLLGGKCSVRSVRSRGTRIQVELPLLAQQ